MKLMKLYIAAFLVLLLAGCRATILEFPEGGGVDPTLVTLDVQLSVDPSIEPYVSGSRLDGIYRHDARWIVEVFHNEISDNPVEHRVLSNEPSPDGHNRIQTSFKLHAANYQIVAWMDYVDKGSQEDKYYKVESLSSIKISDPDKYIGNEDYKDTYVACKEVDLRQYKDVWDGSQVSENWAESNVEIVLQRPMAKIQFITTDVDKYIEEQAHKLGLNSNFPENHMSLMSKLSKFTIEVKYAGYFPSGFNAYTNKPNDARQNVSFTGSLMMLSGNEAQLGSDFVFVNGTESELIVNMLIKDENGNVINDIGDIRVPIVRGKLTTIKDEFLTKNYAPGIGINPDFDGEINITIPD